MGKSDDAQQRAHAIIDILLTRDFVRVSEFAARLNVSEATIRKDLTQLEAQGLLRRMHGGALHRRELTREIQQFYEARKVTHLVEKQRIGRAAAALIQTGEVIAFSGGSTPLQIARQLPSGLAFTAITNDLNIVHLLAQHPQIEVFVPGGYLRMGRDNLIGTHTVAALQAFAIDRLFLTVTGLDLRLGATAGHISNVIYLRELVARCRQCIVVADHSKFHNPAQIVICGWERVSLLITDTGIPPVARHQLEAAGIAVQIV